MVSIFLIGPIGLIQTMGLDNLRSVLWVPRLQFWAEGVVLVLLWVFYLAWGVAASVTKCYWVLYWLGVFLLL